MNLYKVIGYNQANNIYTNPQTGQVENLTIPPFVVGTTPPSDSYADFSSAINWAEYSTSILGLYFGFRDYISLRYQIYTAIETIAGTDYANWNNLSTSEKAVALKWCNIRIINALGLSFFVTACGSQLLANKYVSDYLDNSIVARNWRYQKGYSVFGFNYLGRTQALLAESYSRSLFLIDAYIQRGVVYNSVDGINGLGDWVQGLGDFSTTGLKPRIIDEQFTLTGIGVNDFCDGLVDIIDNGNY